MSLVPPAVQPPQVADGWRPRAAVLTSWLIVACYLAAALALTWRLWADPASRAQTGDMHDVDLFAWFMRYSATAVTHGQLPALVTTAMNAPRGINLMWNTSLLVPSVLLTPVTVLAGPQVSLTVLLTLGFAGSAASLYWVLRQWSASQFAAALGGAVYGFSPALVAASTGHYHLQFAVLPPLLIHLLLRLVTGRGRPVRTGAGLGLLAAVQLLTAEELLAETVLTAAVMLLVLAVCWPRAVRDRLPAPRPAWPPRRAWSRRRAATRCGCSSTGRWPSTAARSRQARSGPTWPRSSPRPANCCCTPGPARLPRPVTRPGCPSTSATWAGRCWWCWPRRQSATGGCPRSG